MGFRVQGLGFGVQGLVEPPQVCRTTFVLLRFFWEAGWGYLVDLLFGGPGRFLFGLGLRA